MANLDDGTTVDSTESTGQDLGQQQEETPPAGGNPAWDTIRNELDPITFSKIEPHLKDWDTGVNQRFENLNKELGWARDLTKAGREPAYIQRALQFADALDADPVAIHKYIGEFLETTGRMPTAKEVENAVETLPEGEASAQAVDPRFDQLAEQQEQIRQFLAFQQQQQIDQQEDQKLDSEIEQLKTAHPEYSKEDIGEVLQRAVLMAQKTGKDVTLVDADASYQAFRNRLLTAPRPGDSAPRLIPTSGGTPAGAPQKSLGEYSRTEVQDLIASLVAQSNEQG